MSEPTPDQASQETARLVLRMDAAISAFRAGLRSGVQALDAASPIVTRVLPSSSMPVSGTRPTERRVPRRPNKV